MTSRSTQIRDAIVDRLLAMVDVETRQPFTKVTKAQTPTLQPFDLPMAQCFVIAETLTPDGDSNAGEPNFVADATIAVSIIRGFEDPDVLDGRIDADIDAVEASLLTDPQFVRFGQGALFESVERIQRRRLFHKEGETYFAELRTEITFRYAIAFDPIIPDAFAEAHITGKTPGPAAGHVVIARPAQT